MIFAAGVTLYNPTENQIENIKKYFSIFNKVYLYDNTDKESNVINVRDFPSNVIYLTEHQNNGLSVAFNNIAENAINDQCDFLCTLDQDSLYEEKDIKAMMKKIESLKSVDDIGIIAPFIYYGFGTIENKDELEEKRYVITSGSFVNLQVIKSTNIRYDEQYFIDKFEIDLGEQMKRSGYKVMMYYGSVLIQSLGDDNGHRHTNHSVLRHYYLFRNRFYFNKKWYGFFKRVALDLLQTARHVLLIWLYENKKGAKTRALFVAIKDYKKNRMGKFNGTI